MTILLAFSQCKNNDQNFETDLEAGFLNPPASARPRVWWHWMNGNITQDGIRKDLQWMNRIGIGGFQNFDAALSTPQIVEKRLVYMTPEWKEAFRYTTELADSLGLEMAIAGSPGWSESGGPWVPPSEGMKKYVWSETTVEGESLFKGNCDIIYIYGQRSNLTALFGAKLPQVPEGYNYDFLNAGAVADVLSVQDGQIATETGMSYRVLALDESARYMTWPVLKKIEELVRAGAVVVGPKPVNTPSLNDDEAEFLKLADLLWGDGKGIKETGKGKIYAGSSLEEALSDLGIEPDFKYSANTPETKMRFVHRSLGDRDIYWVNTSDGESSQAKVSLRISGKKPEVWNPVNGSISPVSYAMEDSRTEVTLNMDPQDALFVVFRKPADKNSVVVPEAVESERTTITGGWEVCFQPGRGAPEMADFNELTPLNENENPGIKYFSGTAEYIKTTQIPEEWISENSKLSLDLGEVHNLAEVAVNGQSLGIVWKKPFRVCISEGLKPGENRLSVKITNLWVNRLIGDQQSGVTNPLTYTTQAFYRADSPLLPSGLLGPVKIVARE